MLPSGPRVTLVFLHHLGGSAETWKPVRARLETRFRCIGLDLPGFGAAAAEPGRSVGGMADWVQSRIAETIDGPWILVGHSMSAKVALLIARRTTDAPAATAAPLAGLVLAAGSPPAPEPMEDDKRRDMLGWFEGDEAQSRREAEGFVSANVARALDGSLHEGAVQDVLRASRHAWRTWLTKGSLEDLRDAIGRVPIPALVLAGAEDEALGHAVQREQMLPHLQAGRLEIVADAAHLLPMEQTDRVAELIASFAAAIEDAGHHMTTRTLELLGQRGRSDAGYVPQVLDQTGLATLRRLVRHLLPMPDGLDIDLAAKLDAKLAEAVGDGWRFATLPPDADAYPQALSALDAVARRDHGFAFSALDDTAVAAIAKTLSDGTLQAGPGFLSSKALQNWCEDVRGDCCQLFLTHPAVLARAGIVASATGNDAGLVGFAELKAGRVEPWERTLWGETVS